MFVRFVEQLDGHPTADDGRVSSTVIRRALVADRGLIPPIKGIDNDEEDGVRYAVALVEGQVLASGRVGAGTGALVPLSGAAPAETGGLARTLKHPVPPFSRIIASPHSIPEDAWRTDVSPAPTCDTRPRAGGVEAVSLRKGDRLAWPLAIGLLILVLLTVGAQSLADLVDEGVPASGGGLGGGAPLGEQPGAVVGVAR